MIKIFKLDRCAFVHAVQCYARFRDTLSLAAASWNQSPACAVRALTSIETRATQSVEYMLDCLMDILRSVYTNSVAGIQAWVLVTQWDLACFSSIPLSLSSCLVSRTAFYSFTYFLWLKAAALESVFMSALEFLTLLKIRCSSKKVTNFLFAFWTKQYLPAHYRLLLWQITLLSTARTLFKASQATYSAVSLICRCIWFICSDAFFQEDFCCYC